jgi:DNA phosphorothioation-associated putative methyltransferase
LAPGIVTLFRDKELEQEVTYRKRSRAAFIADGFEIPKRPPGAIPIARSARERITGELIEIWKSALALGRTPDAGELDPEVRERLAAERVSIERAVLLAMDGTFDRKLLEEAAAARRDDLLVHFALSLFPGAPRYTTLSKSVRRDVKTFFRNHNSTLEHAQRLLFSVGNPEIIRTAAQAAVQSGLGGLVGNGIFRFKTSALPRLPAPIRVMVGCAEVLRDGLLDADFVDISLSGPMVNAIYCDDGNRHFPEIRKVVEVDLQALRSRRRSAKTSVLYLKGRYLPHDDESRSAQARLDAQLLARGIVTEEGVGPSYRELTRLLAPDSAVADAGPEGT